MKNSLLKKYVVSESKKYGLYCVEKSHLRKYQKFVEIGDFASFNAAKSYLERNRKSLIKKIKSAPVNYSEPIFTKKEIKQRIRYGNTFNYNKQNGPVIVTQQAKKSKRPKKQKKQEKTHEISLFDIHKQQAINSRISKEISNSQENIKDYILIKIYKNSKNEYCSKSITKRFKSNSEESLKTNLLNYCSKFNITIISELNYQN